MSEPSDLFEPDIDLTITSPFSSRASDVSFAVLNESLATSDLCELDCNTDSCDEIDESSVYLTDEDIQLDLSVSGNDFGCTPIVYSSDESDSEGKTLSIKAAYCKQEIFSRT